MTMTMKKVSFLLYALVCFTSFAAAQVLQPAKWSYSTSANEVGLLEDVDLIFNVKIDKDWYLYSSDFDPDCGPLVTTILFKPNGSYKLVGRVTPIKPKKKFDETFGCEYTYFRETAQFRQTIKVLGKNLRVGGNYEYQVCTDVDGKCIPFDDGFVFNGIKVVDKSEVKKPLDDRQQDDSMEVVSRDVEAVSPGGGSQETQPSEGVEEVVTQYERERAKDDLGIDKNEGQTPVDSLGLVEEGIGSSLKKLQPFFEEGYEESGKDSYLWLMVAAFFAGLAALLTPCVFPMIPMTVTFFIKDGKGGVFKGMVYGVSIIIIYTILGTLFSLFLGPEGLNALATNWALNIIIFVVFLVFALSFFGLFEITAPSILVNKVDKQADKGGLLGIFFMAATLALVSFSCTVPIVGSILLLSASGEVLRPILGMVAYSLAFAIPFTLFAIFPNLLKSLPKSGGWLNAVKVVLGFVELALAFKFLSVADQAYHWGILDREVNIALWIVIFTLLGFYLLGKVKLPNDSKLEFISVPRLMMAIVSFAFVIYLIPGMYGAPLKALAGYLPPMHTHDFDLISMIRAEENTEDGKLLAVENCETPMYSDFLHLPHGLKGYFDFDQALACAKELNKPLFIDFTGHGCTNCREMEAVVWSDPRVLKRLKEDYVVVALYVDDKTELPDDLWYTSAYDNKVKATLGKQNADLQIQRANNNAQPNYILLGHDEKVLTQPLSYDKDVDHFLEFLDNGKQRFQESTEVVAKN